MQAGGEGESKADPMLSMEPNRAWLDPGLDQGLDVGLDAGWAHCRAQSEDPEIMTRLKSRVPCLAH